MPYLDLQSEAFRLPIQTALAEYGEVLVLHRPNGIPLGRGVEWILVRGEAPLETVFSRMWPGSIVHVFLTPQLPLRGIGSRELQAEFNARVAEGWQPAMPAHRNEPNRQRPIRGPLLFFAFDGDRATYEASGIATDLTAGPLVFWSGQESKWMRRWFYHHLGQHVAIGLYPAINQPNGAEVVAATIPDRVNHPR